MRVVIAGGTGFLGTVLTKRLTAEGHQVVILSRSGGRTPAPDANVRMVQWTPDGSAGPWAVELEGADAVVNVTGADLADKRWTAARKQELYDSRLHTTRSLAAAVRGAKVKPAVFIQQSGSSFYGSYDDGPEFDESSSPGSDFLADLCVAWEAEANPIGMTGCRLVIFRTAPVLTRKHGTLARMLPYFQFFVGGRVASGRQWISWIHLDDWTGLAMWAIGKAAATGPLNATAPHPVTNADFMRAFGRALRRPSWFPVPAFLLRILFGEMADVVLVRGNRVLPRRALDLGYEFKFGQIDAAMADAVKK